MQDRQLCYVDPEFSYAVHGILCLTKCGSRQSETCQESHVYGHWYRTILWLRDLFTRQLKGDLLAGIFTTDPGSDRQWFCLPQGLAPETIVTAVLFSMIGYFNGNNQTLWVMVQGLCRHFWFVWSCLYHEHPAKCQFDEDRTGGTGINDRRYHIKCALLSASEPKKEGHLSKVEDIRNDLCYNSGHKCGRIQTYNAGG